MTPNANTTNTAPMSALHWPARSGALWAAWLVVLATALGGCASKPQPLSPVFRVVLLPQKDETGKTIETAVDVKQGEQAVVLDQPFAVAERGNKGTLFQRVATADEVQARYGDVLKIQPPSADKFILGFLPGKSQLTPESEAQLPGFIERAKARAGGEILVVGHTDTVGKPEANDALSLQRAKAIAKLLEDQGFDPALISARGRGEREPLVNSGDEVAEPRNRRAEIIIR